jgi:hypothetical protein
LAMIKSALRMSSIVIALLGASACSHHERSPEPSAAPGAYASTHTLNSAVDDISDARCDREARCIHVGQNQHFATREACVSKMHTSTTDELNIQDCPKGVDNSRLSDCLKQIESEACDNPIASVSRWSACRRSNLCVGE